MSDAFQPPNECDATGTGMGTLMPTMPTCTSRSNRRAAPPSRVNSATPLPYGFPFTSARASSKDARAHDTEHGAEDLVVVDAHPGFDAVDQRAPDEEAVGRGGGGTRAVDDDARAFVSGVLDVCRDPVTMFTGDERTHQGRRVVAGPDHDVGNPRRDRVDQRISHCAHRDDDRDGHAPLSRRPVGRGDRGVGGRVDVGVG